MREELEKKKGRLVKLSYCLACLGFIVCLALLKTVQGTCLWRAQVHFVSPLFQPLLCSALQPNGLPPHREARFSEVSGLMIIKEIHLNQRAQFVPLISANCGRKTLENVFLTLQGFCLLFV